ncbi:MAG TPA: glycogen/starch synthase [Cyclobacteriaceae bacterium]|jgi:glycogen(starch) synthase|nr:glycogen synthase [Cytophagales bacterium]HNP77483.1 glycogen/starch synthase [Cyclobacteriaceae bacterium]HQQ82395.1 glycogen/starch synthase [Cyclobacteriaceae bacterium]
MSRPKTSPNFPKALLLEIAWEVCNQVGGIYTVIRSKAPAVAERVQGEYCMIGPYLNKNIQAELEPLDDVQDVFGQAAANLRKRGYDVHYAEWLITGKPRVVLLNPKVIEDKALGVIKYLLWKNHGVSTPDQHELVNQVVAFGYLTKLYIDELVKLTKDQRLIAHFHEWMAGLPILDIKREKMPVRTVFTTHATQLGRHLAINSPLFYAHLPFFDREAEAKKFGVVTEEAIEYKCAQNCDVFTTVSDVTARECKHLLKRKPEVILPNGLNIERFEALHEFQNLHAQYKQEIHEFVMGHFFQSYTFDLDKTLYLFTSGRYEFRNKGFDLTLEALWHLNEKLKAEKTDITIVMFFVTKREFYSIRPEVLQSRAMMEEIRQTCTAIEAEIGKKLFYATTRQAENRMPNLNDFVEDYWKLRYRRTLQSWRTSKLPVVVTHKLVNETGDEILQFLNRRNLLNRPEDKVKIVYHPDFITSTNPLFGMDYQQFVRGCHLGVFPSYYEPWGYTPLECMASGVPSVTSDLSGFGDYLTMNFPDHEKNGMFVIERGKRTFDWSSRQLASSLYRFITQSRRDRIMQRNNVENYSAAFDWKNLIRHYRQAYDLAVHAY